MKKSCIQMYIFVMTVTDFLEHCSIYILVGSCCPLVGPNKRRWLEAPQWTRFFHQRHVSLHLWKQLDLDVSQDCINHVIIQPSVRVISEEHMRRDRAIAITFNLENINHWLVLYHNHPTTVPVTSLSFLHTNIDDVKNTENLNFKLTSDWKFLDDPMTYLRNFLNLHA